MRIKIEHVFGLSEMDISQMVKVMYKVELAQALIVDVEVEITQVLLE